MKSAVGMRMGEQGVFRGLSSPFRVKLIAQRVEWGQRGSFAWSLAPQCVYVAQGQYSETMGK